MARQSRRLTDLFARKVAKDGNHPDGQGLYLQVTNGAKSWVHRYTVRGRTRWMGLGSYPLVTIAGARELRDDNLRQIARGVDPIEARKAVRAAAHLEAVSAVSFKDCALSYIEAHKAGWRSSKHAKQWTATLETYAFPHMGTLPVAAVNLEAVLSALKPIWNGKPETASRVRQRIESVLDWAKAKGMRQGENPAAWKGHLDNLLPARAKVRAVRHQPAMPYLEVPGFVDGLEDWASHQALELVILTAKRVGEVRKADWREIDLEAAVWTIPTERMKSGRAFREPLSRQAVALLESIGPKSKGLIFPGAREDKPLSNESILSALQSSRPGLTVHGFRSSFRDWVAERVSMPDARELAEAALSHRVKDKTEAAYQRGDLFEKRRALMQAWADFTSPSLEVLRNREGRQE